MSRCAVSDVTAKRAMPTHPGLCVLLQAMLSGNELRGMWRLSDGREAIVIDEKLWFTKRPASVGHVGEDGDEKFWNAAECAWSELVEVPWPKEVSARLAIVLLCGGAEVE